MYSALPPQGERRSRAQIIWLILSNSQIDGKKCDSTTKWCLRAINRSFALTPLPLFQCIANEIIDAEAALGDRIHDRIMDGFFVVQTDFADDLDDFLRCMAAFLKELCQFGVMIFLRRVIFGRCLHFFHYVIG